MVLIGVRTPDEGLVLEGVMFKDEYVSYQKSLPNLLDAATPMLHESRRWYVVP